MSDLMFLPYRAWPGHGFVDTFHFWDRLLCLPFSIVIPHSAVDLAVSVRSLRVIPFVSIVCRRNGQARAYSRRARRGQRQLLRWTQQL